MRAAADAFRPGQDHVRICAGGQETAFDYAVLAVPFNVLAGMLPEDDAATPLRAMLDHFETSPITGIHLWFDRQITDLPHAVLLDRTIQWMFHKSEILEQPSGAPGVPQNPSPAGAADASPGREPRVGDLNETESRRDGTKGSYVELVVSSSKTLVDRSKQDILDLALRELTDFFPEVSHAKLLKSTVIKEVNATYSPLPGADSHRPSQTSPWPRVFLAGDWTATGWPATMEGAVRSGYLAAEALTRAAGKPQRYLVPDLPPRGFMRLFGK